MSAESTEELAPPALGARRVDTPPRAIFNDYQSAYQSILSPDRNLTETQDFTDTAKVPATVSAPSKSDDTVTKPSSPRHRLRLSSCSRESDSRSTQEYSRCSMPVGSPISKGEINFLRPTRSSSPRNGKEDPADQAARNSTSVLKLGNFPPSIQDRSLNATQCNLGEVYDVAEQSSWDRGTVGSNDSHAEGTCLESKIQESHADPRGYAHEENIVTRDTFDADEFGAGGLHVSNSGRADFVAQQPPIIPLSSGLLGATDKGFTSEELPKTSLSEDTEKLLKLTQRSGATGSVCRPYSDWLSEAVSDEACRLDTEFSWMGKKGWTSFRDVSAKEMKQLCSSNQGQSSGVSTDVVQAQGGESNASNNVVSDAVYHQLAYSVEQPHTREELVKYNARRASMVSAYLVPPPQKSGSGRAEKPSVEDDEKHRSSEDMAQGLLDEALMDSSGLQSWPSCGESAKAFVAERCSGQASSIDQGASASPEGYGGASRAHCSRVGMNSEGHVVAETDDSEDAEWESLRESGKFSKYRIHPSVGRDISGSSLANVSSNVASDGGSEDERCAGLPWDPLMPSPLKITPPTKVVVRPHSGRISSVCLPPRAPRNASFGHGGISEQSLFKASSATPALTVPTKSQSECEKGKSRVCCRPTPLKGEHQNPFRSSPPLIDAQTLGASFELDDLKEKASKKRQAIHGDPCKLLRRNTARSDLLRLKNPDSDPVLLREAASSQSVDGSYSTTDPNHLTAAGSRTLNRDPSHIGKSTRWYKRRSFTNTEAFLPGKPRRKLAKVDQLSELNSPGTMAESERYQRIRDNMGCGTSGIVRAPGMQQVAPPQAHIGEELVGPTKPYRAANPAPDSPRGSSLGQGPLDVLSAADISEEISRQAGMATTAAHYTNNNSIVMIDMTKTCPAFHFDDGSGLQSASCERRSQWEFSGTPRLTECVPKDDVKTQREAGNRILILLTVTVLGWLILVPLVACNVGNGRDKVMRQYTQGACQSFHPKEVIKARVLAVAILIIIGVTVGFPAAYA